MNLLGIYTVGVARSLCGGLLLDMVIVNCPYFMTFSITFTQCAPETTKFSKITQNKGHFAVKVIQGHRFWYQSKAHVRLPISDLNRTLLERF